MKILASAIKLGIMLASLKSLFAYLDPGSGSLIVQILIAIVVGIAATFRLWKSRLLSILGVKQAPEDDDGADELETHDSSQP